MVSLRSPRLNRDDRRDGEDGFVVGTLVPEALASLTTNSKVSAILTLSSDCVLANFVNKLQNTVI